MPAKGDVPFRVTFTVSGEQSVQRKVTQLMGGIERKARKNASSLGLINTQLRKLGRSALFGLASFASVTAVVGGFKAIASSLREIQELKQGLEKDITPLLSLGENVENIAEIKREVLGLKAVFGEPSKGVGRFLFSLESDTANLSKAIRDDLKKETLELTKVTGGSLLPATKLMVKMYQIYGDEITDVNVLQNKLFKTQQLAAAEFEELAARFPDLASAARVAGLSFDEFAGSFIGVSKLGGGIEKTSTGMRNVLLIMDTAKKKGVEFTGPFIQKLEQMGDLAKKDEEKFKDMFGRETITTATNFIRALKDIEDSIKQLGKVTAEEDLVAEKFQKRLQDATFLQAKLREIQKAFIENVPLDPARKPGAIQRIEERARSASLAARGVVPEGLEGVAGFIAGTTAAAAPGLAAPVVEAGRRRTVEDTRAAGDPATAAAFEKVFEKDRRERNIRQLQLLKGGGQFGGFGQGGPPLTGQALDTINELIRVEKEAIQKQAAGVISITGLLSGIKKIVKTIEDIATASPKQTEKALKTFAFSLFDKLGKEPPSPRGPLTLKERKERALDERKKHALKLLREGKKDEFDALPQMTKAARFMRGDTPEERRARIRAEAKALGDEKRAAPQQARDRIGAQARGLRHMKGLKGVPYGAAIALGTGIRETIGFPEPSEPRVRGRFTDPEGIEHEYRGREARQRFGAISGEGTLPEGDFEFSRERKHRFAKISAMGDGSLPMGDFELAPKKPRPRFAQMSGGGALKGGDFKYDPSAPLGQRATRTLNEPPSLERGKGQSDAAALAQAVKAAIEPLAQALGMNARAVDRNTDAQGKGARKRPQRAPAGANMVETR